MADVYNSGTIGHGAITLTIDSVAYKAESITPDLPTQELRRYDPDNVPNGLILTADFDTGSAVLQLATGTTVLPERGQTFTADLIRAGSTQTWVIKRVSPPMSLGDIHKVNIDFIKAP